MGGVLDIVPHKIAVVAIVVLVTILVVSWKWSMLGVILGFGALLLCWITAAIFFQLSCAETDLCMKLILAVVYKTARSLFTESQRLSLVEKAEMDNAITDDIEKLRRELSIADFYKVMSKVKLYHVAVGKHDLARTFTPRVPESANPPEDTITPRICFAESLEGCLSAIGHPFYYPGKPELLTVWEYDADTRYCIPPEYLYDKGLVMDSLRTREWWVLQPLTLTGKYVNLVNFETTPYRLPDESKKQEIIKYIKCNALNFDDTDMALLQKSNIHEILYKVLGNWDRYHIDEEDVADFVGLDNCKTYCNCKFEEAYNVK